MNQASKTVLVVTALPDDFIRFRFQILQAMRTARCTVVAAAAKEDPLAGVLKVDVPTFLAEHGITYHTFPLFRTGMNPIKDLGTLQALYLLCKRTKPDVMLCCNAKPVVYGALAGKLAGVKSINSLITGLAFGVATHRTEEGLAARIARLLYRLALSLNQLVIFQNPDDHNELRQAGIISANAATGIVNGSGVDIDRFQPVPLPDGPITFLTISRLLKEKGIVEFAEAARIIRSKYPTVQFALVGPADTHSDAIPIEMVRAWESDGILTWYGQTSDVRKFIAKAHVYVLPSYHEGTPRTVLEAMAMGRPIITTDAPGCRQTVVEGNNGYLVPVKNTQAVADTMEIFIQQPELIATMGSISRIIAIDKYDGRKVGRDVVQLLSLSAEQEDKNDDE